MTRTDTAPTELRWLTAPDQAVVRVDGPEAEAFLTRIVTCGLHRLEPGDAMPGALLSPQGKVQHAFIAHRLAPDALHLALPTSGLESLIKRFTLLRLRAKVAFTPVSDLAAQVAPSSDGGLTHRLVDADAAAAPAPSAYHAARIAAGAPEQDADYGVEEVFPTDVNLDLRGGLDFAKGCFIGQEVVSRMKRRGSIRKRTLIVTAQDGPLTAARGAPITEAGGGAIGSLMSHQDAAGLAVIRLDRLAAAGGVQASVLVEGQAARLSFASGVPALVQAAAEPNA